MDRPILAVMIDADDVCLYIDYPPGESPGPVRIERQALIDELAFPRPYERGLWIRLPVRRAETANYRRG